MKEKQVLTTKVHTCDACFHTINSYSIAYRSIVKDHDEAPVTIYKHESCKMLQDALSIEDDIDLDSLIGDLVDTIWDDEEEYFLEYHDKLEPILKALGEYNNDKVSFDAVPRAFLDVFDNHPDMKNVIWEAINMVS